MRKPRIPPVLEHIKPAEELKRLDLAEFRIVSQALVG